MILPKSKLEGFLYFTYDDYADFFNPVTKVTVVRLITIKSYFLWFSVKKEIKDVYEFRMVVTHKDGLNWFHKTPPCLELIEQLNELSQEMKEKVKV